MSAQATKSAPFNETVTVSVEHTRPIDCNPDALLFGKKVRMERTCDGYLDELQVFAILKEHVKKLCKTIDNCDVQMHMEMRQFRGICIFEGIRFLTTEKSPDLKRVTNPEGIIFIDES